MPHISPYQFRYKNLGNCKFNNKKKKNYSPVIFDCVGRILKRKKIGLYRPEIKLSRCDGMSVRFDEEEAREEERENKEIQRAWLKQTDDGTHGATVYDFPLAPQFFTYRRPPVCL